MFLWLYHFSSEFKNIANWVALEEVADHMVELIYALLDDNYDGFLSVKEFSPVLFQWRKSRGFQHGQIQIELGQLRI